MSLIIMFVCRWNFWKRFPTANWMEVYRDRIIMETKIICALQATAVNCYSKADICKKDLDSFVHLADENASHSCYADDALCELLHGDVW